MCIVRAIEDAHASFRVALGAGLSDLRDPRVCPIQDFDPLGDVLANLGFNLHSLKSVPCIINSHFLEEAYVPASLSFCAPLMHVPSAVPLLTTLSLESSSWSPPPPCPI